MSNTNTTNFVFIVSRGERGEGSSILAVCSTFDQAKGIGLAEEVYDFNEDGSRDPNSTWKLKGTRLNYKGVETTLWSDRSDCDFISIEKHPIRNN